MIRFGKTGGVVGAISVALSTAVAVAPSYAETGGKLEEIVVTAQKQAQNIQTVPITIQAFDSNEISEKGFLRVSDLTTHVPNVDFFSFFSEAQTPALCFRGVCLTQLFSDSYEPPVAMYTDEVYVGSGFAQALQLFDVERIEVLKGPQGTLYGRNTTGGLVNVITRKPSHELEMNFSVDYSSYNSLTLEGGIGGPLTDGVRGRIAVQTRTSDGWVDSVTDNSKADEADTKAARGALDFDITDKGSLLLSSYYFKVDQGAEANMLNGTVDPNTGEQCSYSQLQSGNCIGIYSDYTSGTESANSLYGGLKPDKWLGYDMPGGGAPHNHLESIGIEGRFEWDFDAAHFTSISSFANGKKDYLEDVDGNLGAEYEDRLIADADTLSQEFRLDGNWGMTHWITGVFYYNDDRDTGTQLVPAANYADKANKETTSYAVYGNLEIPLSEQWSAVLGARYTDEEISVDFSRSGYYPAYPVDHEKRSVDSDNLDWKAVLQWEPNDNTMVYGSVTTAFRSANINSQSIYGPIVKGSPTDPMAPVDPEKMISYELGFKSEFFDGRARLNTSAFYYTIDDMQTLIWVFTTSTTGVSRLKNIKSVDAWGAEMDLQVQATERLMLTLSAGFLDSEVDSSESIDVDGELIPLDGHELPFSNPSATLGANYTIPLAERGSLSLQADYKWKDDHYFSVRNTTSTYQESYGLLDVRAVWKSPQETYSVEVYGNNVLDEEYYVYAGNIATNTQNIVWGKPAWYGVKFGYQF